MKTFELKKGLSNDIIVYKVNKVPHKIYLKDATDSFMTEFLKHGTEEEIRECYGPIYHGRCSQVHCKR